MKIDVAVQQIRDSRDFAGVVAALEGTVSGPVFRYIPVGLADQGEDLQAIDVTLKIPDFRVKSFLREMDKINRQAGRLGLPPLESEFIGTERQRIKIGGPGASKNTVHLSSMGRVDDRTNATFIFEAHIYRVTGKPPVLSAWKFKAAINHSEHSQPIIKSLAPEIPAHYMTATTYCEHCNTNRGRNDVFLLQNVRTGKWMQVGRSCLQQFTGVENAERAMSLYVSALEFIDNFDDMGGDDGEGFGGGAAYAGVDLDAFVQVAAWLTDKYGYISRSASETEGGSSTGDAAYGLLQARTGELAAELRTIMEDATAKAKAEAAIEWAKNLPDDNSDSYRHNLRVIARDGYFSARKELGFAASLYQAYRRAMDEQRRLEMSASDLNEHLPAKVGDKLTGYRLRTISIRELNTQYGVSYLHLFQDEKGRHLKWFGTKRIEAPDGFQAEFTIKDHDEYKGQKQTVITRVKDMDAAARAKRTELVSQIGYAVQAGGVSSDGRGEGEASAIPDDRRVSLGVTISGLTVFVDDDRTLLNLRDMAPDNPDPDWLVSMPVNKEVRALIRKLEKLA